MGSARSTSEKLQTCWFPLGCLSFLSSPTVEKKKSMFFGYKQTLLTLLFYDGFMLVGLVGTLSKFVNRKAISGHLSEETPHRSSGRAIPGGGPDREHVGGFDLRGLLRSFRGEATGAALAVPASFSRSVPRGFIKRSFLVLKLFE